MKRLFLLEDDLSLINGLSFALKKQGYEVAVARTSLEAERLWTDGEYHLAILDVSLPDGSGFDFCRKVRKTSKIPIERSRKLFKFEFPPFFITLFYLFLHTPEKKFHKFYQNLLTYNPKCAARLVTIYASHQTRPL